MSVVFAVLVALWALIRIFSVVIAKIEARKRLGAQGAPTKE
jgi:Na+-transporting methylmalonyl-CoA/oxaloacetate decarboxylase gamma subunit